MRVAIILTGHMRCWEKVFPNFKEHFIDRYNPDIFIHTWDDEGYWVPQEGAMGINMNSPKLDVEAVRAAYNPVEMVVEDFSKAEPLFANKVKRFSNYYHRPRNIISMFYKIMGGIHVMFKQNDTGVIYDLIIRMRPDMILHEPMPEFEPGVFYTLAHRNHMGGGTGDMFQIGTTEQMAAFGKFDVDTLYDQTGLLCPHIMSAQHIQNLGLPWKEFHVRKTIQHTPKGEYQA